jgi:alpha-glucosidase
MQYGTLTPFCRNHSEIGNVDQYAWAFGRVIEDLVRRAVQLRYRLLPYLYATFLQASETGSPVQRPLVFDYQYDPTVRDIDDEYLLGSDLLVAPVVEAGTTSRHVYLPGGCWYDWHSGEAVGGSRFLDTPTPMDRIPIFCRGGSIVSMWPEAPASTAGYHPKYIELHVFVPDVDGTHQSFLQEDDGLTFAALTGARYRTTFVLTRRRDHITLTAETDGDGYPEFAREAFHLVVHGAAPGTVRLDGAVVARTDADSYPPLPEAGRFVLPNSGTGFSVDFDV